MFVVDAFNEDEHVRERLDDGTCRCIQALPGVVTTAVDNLLFEAIKLAEGYAIGNRGSISQLHLAPPDVLESTRN